MNRGETEITDHAQRRELVGEKAVEPVGHGSEGERVETAPLLIIVEQVGIADIETEPAPMP